MRRPTGAPSGSVVPVRNDVVMAYDFTRFGERRFEDLCRALAVHALGPGIQAFGDGPDGGREATYQGAVVYPGKDPELGWNGYIVLQAKYRRQGAGDKDAEWLCREITKELAAWSATGSNRARRGALPEYLIIATNVRLSSVSGVGGLDRVRVHLSELGNKLGLKGHDVWEANKLTAYLLAFPHVATHFADVMTPGDVLARAMALIDRLDTASAVRSEYVVGRGGDRSMGRPFVAAHRRAGGPAALGEPTSQVFAEGPGWVQRFDTCPDGGSAVICALPGQRAVAVDAQVWDALLDAGAIDGWLAATGYPEVTDNTPPLIGLDASSIGLTGGRWGPGRLVPRGRNWWQAAPQWGWQARDRFPRPCEGYRWSTHGDHRVDFRLRCTVRFGWKTPVTIDSDGPRRLERGLADEQCPLGRLVPELAGLLHLPVSELAWERMPPTEGDNNAHCASYRQRLVAPNGNAAIGAWVRLQAPTVGEWTTLSVVDLRVDLAAARELIRAAEPLYRPTAADLHAVFVLAMKGAMRVLPLAMRGGPLSQRAVGATVIELHIDSERPPDRDEERLGRLLNVLDLDDLGEPPAHLGYTMAVAMTTSAQLTDQEIGDTVHELISRMGSSCGLGLDRD
jgi:hypothetical protein